MVRRAAPLLICGAVALGGCAAFLGGAYTSGDDDAGADGGGGGEGAVDERADSDAMPDDAPVTDGSCAPPSPAEACAGKCGAVIVCERPFACGDDAGQCIDQTICGSGDAGPNSCGCEGFTVAISRYEMGDQGVAGAQYHCVGRDTSDCPSGKTPTLLGHAAAAASGTLVPLRLCAIGDVPILTKHVTIWRLTDSATCAGAGGVSTILGYMPTGDNQCGSRTITNYTSTTWGDYFHGLVFESPPGNGAYFGPGTAGHLVP